MKQEVVVWWGDTILDHFHYSGDRRLLPEGAVVLEALRRSLPIITSVKLTKPAPKPAAAAYHGVEGTIGRRDRLRTRPAPMKHADPRNTGLLATLRSMGGATSSVMSGDMGDSLNAALEGLRGPSGMADAGGFGGMGTRGTGAGGGGRSIAIVGLDLSQHRASDGVELGGTRRRAADLPPKKFEMEGGLTQAEVARVIQRAKPRIKFCYEKELQADPNLAGKIRARFTIAPTGRVAATSIVESSMRSTKVESCVQGVLQSLVFPKPRGGGIVVVMYPFIFEST